MRNRGRYPKTAFAWDWIIQTLTCPAGVTQPFTMGKVTRFPATAFRPCAQREQCTRSRTGRLVQVHAEERLFTTLRAAQQTTAGRAQLRERVAVEHSLAHIGQWQGARARYCGVRKHLFNLLRVATLANLRVLARQQPLSLPIAS